MTNNLRYSSAILEEPQHVANFSQKIIIFVFIRNNSRPLIEKCSINFKASHSCPLASFFYQISTFFHSFPDQSSDEEYEDNFKDSTAKVNHHSAESNEEDDAEEDDEEIDHENDDEVLKSNMSWKDNLAQKAREAYLDRHSNTDNLMKLVYGVFSMVGRKHLSYLTGTSNNILLFPA